MLHGQHRGQQFMSPRASITRWVPSSITTKRPGVRVGTLNFTTAAVTFTCYARLGCLDCRAFSSLFAFTCSASLTVDPRHNTYLRLSISLLPFASTSSKQTQRHHQHHHEQHTTTPHLHHHGRTHYGRYRPSSTSLHGNTGRRHVCRHQAWARRVAGITLHATGRR